MTSRTLSSCSGSPRQNNSTQHDLHLLRRSEDRLDQRIVIITVRVQPDRPRNRPDQRIAVGHRRRHRRMQGSAVARGETNDRVGNLDHILDRLAQDPLTLSIPLQIVDRLAQPGNA
ncbi:MAG: hypothetical protein WBN83_13345 [Desulfoprunum sp.]|uniref:hypothetical protein n=1 Tax=Desulfoprunum sp. TaxID=2020866 RepID=UPI003C74C7CB